MGSQRLAPEALPPGEERRPLGSADQVLAHARETGSKYLVHVFGDQSFLDAEIALKGLLQAESREVDYFTQWEHCRLPLGVGVRAFRITTLEKIGDKSLAECQRRILTKPELFNVIFDEGLYVSYEDSMLSARLTGADFAKARAGAPSFDLKGFLAVAGKDLLPPSELDEPASTGGGFPEPSATMVDERREPATYGFESLAAAEFPTYIMFDLTNRCNAKCIHCPQSTLYADNNQGRAFLPLETFRKAVDECKGKKIQFVRLTGDGEPFVHPKLFDMIDYAVKADIGPVGLTTNGSLMTAPKAERLVNSGLFMIDVSLDAYTDATYSIVRKGLTFAKTVENLEYLIAYRNRIKSPMKVMVSFVKQKENAHEVEAFEKHWEKKVDKVLIRELISNVNQVSTEGSKGAAPEKRWPCAHWWRRMVINFDGKLKPCPIDWTSGTAYKTLDEVSITDAWHSDFFSRHRMEHLNNNFSESSICKNCPDWRGTPWNLGYEKVIRNLD
jgi:MoaA/NifB/PqqE/SkfB family radical SAM enzyme